MNSGTRVMFQMVGSLFNLLGLLEMCQIYSSIKMSPSIKSIITILANSITAFLQRWGRLLFNSKLQRRPPPISHLTRHPSKQGMLLTLPQLMALEAAPLKCLLIPEERMPESGLCTWQSIGITATLTPLDQGTHGMLSQGTASSIRDRSLRA